MTYFETRVQSQSKEELERRVRDNKKRGFQVARYYEIKREGRYATNSKYRTADGGTTRIRGSTEHVTYGAVMRRVNNGYSSQRKKADFVG